MKISRAKIIILIGVVLVVLVLLFYNHLIEKQKTEYQKKINRIVSKKGAGGGDF